MRSFLLWSGHVVIVLVFLSAGIHFHSIGACQHHYSPSTLFSSVSNPPSCFCLRALDSGACKEMISSQNHSCHRCNSKSWLVLKITFVIVAIQNQPSSLVLTLPGAFNLFTFQKSQKSILLCFFAASCGSSTLSPWMNVMQRNNNIKHVCTLGFGFVLCLFFFKNKKYFLPLAPTSLFCASAAKLA